MLSEVASDELRGFWLRFEIAFDYWAWQVVRGILGRWSGNLRPFIKASENSLKT
jgi:hypothetical protein